MNLLAHILAAKEFDWIQIVIIAIVLGAGLIGSIFQKLKEQQKEAKTRKPGAESGQRQARSPRTVQPTRPAPPAPPDEQAVRVSQELGLRQQRQAQLDKDRQKRLASRQSPQSDSNAIEARLVSIRSAEADTAIRKIGEIGVILQLATTAEARRAIILHEVFSPPKALRQGGEMWDT